jgi:hypothetical protein
MYDHQIGIVKGNPVYSALVKHSLENPSLNFDFGGVELTGKPDRRNEKFYKCSTSLKILIARTNSMCRIV